MDDSKARNSTQSVYSYIFARVFHCINCQMYALLICHENISLSKIDQQPITDSCLYLSLWKGNRVLFERLLHDPSFLPFKYKWDWDVSNPVKWKKCFFWKPNISVQIIHLFQEFLAGNAITVSTKWMFNFQTRSNGAKECYTSITVWTRHVAMN